MRAARRSPHGASFQLLQRRASLLLAFVLFSRLPCTLNYVDLKQPTLWKPVQVYMPWLVYMEKPLGARL